MMPRYNIEHKRAFACDLIDIPPNAIGVTVLPKLSDRNVIEFWDISWLIPSPLINQKEL